MAASVDPTRSNRVRRFVIELVKQLELLDAKILEYLWRKDDDPSPASDEPEEWESYGEKTRGQQNRAEWRSIARDLKVTAAELLVSLKHLERLDCTQKSNGRDDWFELSVVGCELMRAPYD